MTFKCELKTYIYAVIYFKLNSSYPATDRCGDSCNKTIFIDGSIPGLNIYDWESVGWGDHNYADDCICILTVEVKQSIHEIYISKLKL